MNDDRYAEPENRDRSMRSEKAAHRRDSIFGREANRWDNRYDRSWRDTDNAQDRDRELMRSQRSRGGFRDERRPGRMSGRSSERQARERDERHFGPDDYRDDLPRDETSHLIASNKVEGTAVYGRDGTRLGTIYNFMVDKRSGRVEYAVMAFGGFLGMGSRYYPIPWRMLTYRPAVAGYEVDLTERDLHEAPSFDERTEPRFDRAYGRDVYDYYGYRY